MSKGPRPNKEYTAEDVAWLERFLRRMQAEIDRTAPPPPKRGPKPRPDY